MGRLSRAQMQARTRARVLAAAQAEFADRGFRQARIDAIAERAGLTRGAVYSNFPGKRALYLEVLARLAEHPPEPPAPARPGTTAEEALGSLARAWLAGVAGADGARAALDLDPGADVLADERARRAFARLSSLNALLLALALEAVVPLGAPGGTPAPRLVRLAETVLTTLHGASRLAAFAPGFGQPFDVISACERLAGLRLNDWYAPPEVTSAARPGGEPWSPPPARDVVRGEPARLGRDGVVAVLGLHRLAAAEDAARAAAPGADVTVALVTSDPGEHAPLARLVLARFADCLRQGFPRAAWPRLRVVCDDSGALAAAAGVPAVGDDTEAAVRVAGARVAARADGPGAALAVARPPRRPVAGPAAVAAVPQ
jgi:AcrR family transcriptional regulator